MEKIVRQEPSEWPLIELGELGVFLADLERLDFEVQKD